MRSPLWRPEIAMPISVWTCTAQYAAVQGEARTVDAGLLVEVLVHADLDQVRRRDLGVEQLVPLYQEHPVFARHAHRRMIVDDVAPAVVRDQAIDRGEIDPRLPFLRRDAALGDGCDIGVDVHGILPMHSSELSGATLGAILHAPAMPG